MTESEFWTRLEMRVCREFEGLQQKEFCALWCDGFRAATFFPHEMGSRIVGRAWIGKDGQGEWEFELIVRRAIEAWEEVNWDELLPGEDVTGWMSVNLERKLMKIDPSAAYPDKDPLPEYRERN
jgi:hypothetical protein